MMNEPSIEKLTADGLNRYQLCVATSKVARKIIKQYNDEDASLFPDEKGNVKHTVRDDKPVKTAVHAIDRGDYSVILPEADSEDELKIK